MTIMVGKYDTFPKRIIPSCITLWNTTSWTLFMNNTRLAGTQTTGCIGDAGQTEAAILTSVDREPSKSGEFSMKDMQIWFDHHSLTHFQKCVWYGYPKWCFPVDPASASLIVWLKSSNLWVNFARYTHATDQNPKSCSRVAGFPCGKLQV